ncbi:hypothetical protein [Cesiribacter andamanensis]|uniref:hypothetical protein n=1 Tax=Cesiribacter andamanensis TaxID=649507 RepID=UPI00058D2103|nr:hypothetical protein [Cesiribacter andamanensis]
MNKWKIAFIIMLTISVVVIVMAAYFVFTNTLSSGNCKDNQIVISEDLEFTSKAISKGASTINEFDKEFQNMNAGHWTEVDNQIIRLQIVKLIFDKDGKFEKIIMVE